MGKIVGLHHVGLFIKDRERSKKFYSEVLGFAVDYEVTAPDGTKIAFMKNGDCVIEIVEFVEPKDHVDGWFDHLALRVENIEEVKAELVAQGIPFDTEEIVDFPTCYPNGSKYILFRGPDGEHLEINERM